MFEMRAMLLNDLAPLARDSDPLVSGHLPDPDPGPGEVRLEVAVCGVCHTELDEIEGRTPPARLPVVPGHQVVGRIDRLGPAVSQVQVGQRVGVGWIHSSSGAADENLSPDFVATGRDVHGGYAEYMTVPAGYAFPIPDTFDDVHAAPLLCAGAVGYRSLTLCHLSDGQALGFTGFGGSAHLVLQMVRYRYPHSEIYVFARDSSAREFARTLGATWAGDTRDRAPRALDAIIDTTPAWTPVVEALANLAPGGRLVINAIRKEDGDKASLQSLRYDRDLWMEKQIQSVANVTARDVAEFLPLAAAANLQVETQVYPLDQANLALRDLKFQPVRGAKVLQVGR